MAAWGIDRGKQGLSWLSALGVLPLCLLPLPGPAQPVTPSVGFVPERIKSDKADVFRITLEPGQTITYVAELAGERYARMYLWQPIDYEIKSRDRQLFNGAMLGLTGLLAIFLTAIFAA